MHLFENPFHIRGVFITETVDQVQIVVLVFTCLDQCSQKNDPHRPGYVLDRIPCFSLHQLVVETGFIGFEKRASQILVCNVGTAVGLHRSFEIKSANTFIRLLSEQLLVRRVLLHLFRAEVDSTHTFEWSDELKN